MRQPEKDIPLYNEYRKKSSIKNNFCAEYESLPLPQNRVYTTNFYIKKII